MLLHVANLRSAYQTAFSQPEKLKQDVETSKNSTYDMLGSVLHQHQQVTSALSLSKKKHLDVSDAEIELLEAARQTLQPFYDWPQLNYLQSVPHRHKTYCRLQLKITHLRENGFTNTLFPGLLTLKTLNICK